MSIFYRRGWHAESTPYSLPALPITSDPPTSPRLVRKDVYEGGNDVWECSEDLSALITSIFSSPMHSSLRPSLVKDNLKVLEIGAGHGKPSLTLCRLRETLGLKTAITLQDLNESSLIHHTLPSFQHSLNPNLTEITLVSCAWDSMLSSRDHTSKSAEEATDDIWDYHLVLSSETLYRKENFPVLSKILTRILPNRPQAKALFAQKRYYFGLGGGTMPFQLYLKDQGLAQLKSEIVHTVENGQSNVRDILLIG